MHYIIGHTLFYAYESPVLLDPHILRLRPRSDVGQTLVSYNLQITPQPEQQFQTIEVDGNAVQHLWFPSIPVSNLQVQMQAQVETHRKNPFDFLLSRWSTQLPIDYPLSLSTQLAPYLERNSVTLSVGIDPQAMALAQTIHHATGGNIVMFLCELTQRIYKDCTYVIRETGDPQLPGMTWTQKSGSCRDYAVLFIEACRAIGIAARFVSGYHEGDPDVKDYHLHAWAEVYLPGAGWRGFDPTIGLAVSDRHIALAASPFPSYTAPISGTLRAGSTAEATMSYQLSITNLNKE